MLIKNFKRYILIEPNLINYGHVVEVPLNLQRHLLENKVNFEIVGNQKVDTNVANMFPTLIKGVTDTSFTNLENNGEQFYVDLKRLDKTIRLNDKDLVIILSSYTNEVEGSEMFVKEKNGASPTFCLWFHQIFPPQDNFLDTTRKQYRQTIREKLKCSFNLSRIGNKIHFFTTPSEKLRSVYQEWTAQRFNILPLPYAPQGVSKIYKEIKNKANLKLGFLGDGRYEKGLLLVMELIISSKRRNHYIIQNINPRGYPKKDLDKFYTYIEQLKLRKNVGFCERPLLPDEFSQLIDKVDIVLLPYHPQSYDARVSGILIESIIKKKPVIAPKETWLGEQINSMRVGEIFEYANDYKKRLFEFNSAVERAMENFPKYKTEKASLVFQKYYSSHNFFKMLKREIK